MPRLLVLTIVTSATLFVPGALASAGPVTVGFSGRWSFHDAAFESPEFHAAMGTYGIVDATPLLLSLTVDDAATSPSGIYPGALLTGELTIGSLSYTVGRADFRLSQSCVGITCSGAAHLFAHLSGPTLSAGSSTFYPNFIQFDSHLSFSSSNSLSSSLASASGWQNPFIFVSFWNQPVIPPQFGSAGDMGISALQFEKVSVPEPDTLPLIAIALVALYSSRRFGYIGRG